ncbi:MAG: 5'-methylthioadenosine/adenosylhomocysteine nucleosidase [Mailhella sp.]|nr:5'-methylthioadenosine/adenosylhomocysteine nucleosidase [Mailhella sp.]
MNTQRIGILSAMDPEIAVLLEHISGLRTERIAAVDYHVGELDGVPVVICNGGVGKVNAAMHTQIMIDRFAPSVIIQNGVAGSLSPKVGRFDVVIGSELVYHDMQAWVLENFEPLRPVYASDAGLVELASSIDPAAHVGRIATGDLFVSEAAVKADIVTRTGALCTEMEGCAVAHTATLNGVPFVVLRTISDSADDDASMDFGEFLQKASDRSCEFVRKLVARMAE